MFSYIALNVYLGYFVLKIFFSNEGRNLLTIEKQFGIKEWQSFLVRYFLVVCYIYLFIGLESILLLSLAVNFDISFIAVYVALPHLNYLLLVLFIISIIFILVILFSKVLGTIFYTTLMVLTASSPILSSALKSENNFEHVRSVDEFLININLGKQFYRAAKDDNLTLYSENAQQLFGDWSNPFYYSYLGDDGSLMGLNNFNENAMKKFDENLWKSYFYGQTLNKNLINDEEIYIMGFDPSFLDMFLSLKETLKDMKINKELNGYLRVVNTVNELKKTNFGSKYRNLVSFVEKNYELFQYKENDFKIDDNNSEKEFYQEHPEFLQISSLFTQGFTKSWMIEIGDIFIIDQNSNTRKMNLNDYYEIISKSKKRQFLNYFNFSKYLQFQYSDPLYTNQYLSSVYYFWDLEITKYFKVEENMLYNSVANSNFLNTTSSVFDSGVEVKKTNILVYVYSIYIIKILIGFIVSIFLFQKKSFRN
ncbi:hypothetical protein [Spiroplasma chinense]|nr:hypothetical protein [Spiroplasma chinense]